MRTWFEQHRTAAAIIAAAVALAATEGFLLIFYLNSWLDLPL